MDNIYTGVNSGCTYQSSSLIYWGGSALYCTGTYSVSVPFAFMNLTYRSFTVEAWIRPITSLGVELGIFGQCVSSSITDQCLVLSIKTGRLHMSFGNDDAWGGTLLSLNTWYYVAFVYDDVLLEKSIYLNGALDGASMGGPYAGMSGTVTIGSAASGSPFTGYIDQVIVSGWAKSACQVLNDYSLVAYYPLDSGTTLQDYSVSSYFVGSTGATSLVTGRINQALLLSAATSNFQVEQ